MFSHNGRISEKQMRCMLDLYVFMGVIFVLPYLLAHFFGKDIIVGAMLFFVMSALYIGAVVYILRDIDGGVVVDKSGNKTDENNIDEGKNASDNRDKDVSGNTDNGGRTRDGGKTDDDEKTAKFIHDNGRIGDIKIVIRIIRYVIRLVFYILLSVSVLSEGQVPYMKENGGNSFINLLILLPLLIVALYGAGKDVEKQGRISEMLMPAAILPYALMILLGVKECSFKGNIELLPTDMSVYKIILPCYALLSLVVPIEIYPWLKLRCINKKKTVLSSYLSVMAFILLACIISVLMALIYGVNGMAGDAMASISIMRYIELPLGVLRRFDVLMVWFYMTGCFILLSNTMFFIRQNLSPILSEEHQTIAMTVVLLAAFMLALVCPRYEEAVKIFIIYGAVAELPLSFITLLIERHRKKLKKILSVVLIVFVVSITGCSPDIENIEQRDYATLLMIAPSENGECLYTVGTAKEHRRGEEYEAENLSSFSAENLDELSKIYGDRKGKELSLSHLKVILVAPYSVHVKIPGSEYICEVVNDLGNNDEVAKTCPLLFVKDKDEIIEYISRTKSPVGTYISDLINVRKRNGKKVAKLMDYLRSMRDDMKVDMLLLNVNDDDIFIEQLR